jgi:hypothetical protein
MQTELRIAQFQLQNAKYETASSAPWVDSASRFNRQTLALLLLDHDIKKGNKEIEFVPGDCCLDRRQSHCV